MELVFLIMGMLIICIIAYYALCHIIKIWTGCDDEQAAIKVQNFINGTPQYSFYNDPGFMNAVTDTVRNVIGDCKMQRLLRLLAASANNLLYFGRDANVPYVAIFVGYVTDQEKQMLENILAELMIRYLCMYGYSQKIIADWKIYYDLKMPYIQFKYSSTKQEEHLLDMELRYNLKKSALQDCPLLDDAEDEDIDDD